MMFRFEGIGMSERNRKQVIGNCGDCKVAVREGDRGYAYEDGPVFCETHAPTMAVRKSDFGELLAIAESEQAGTTDDFGRELWAEDIADYQKIIAACDAHVAGGGAWTDRAAYEL